MDTERLHVTEAVADAALARHSNAMATSPEPEPLISPSDMQIVERVLNMRTGYVLDFSDRTFDEFIAHEVGIDATAPRFSVDGGSKAKRLRRILPSLPAGQQAKLLRDFMKHRDGSSRTGEVDVLDEEWRRAYGAIIAELEKSVADSDTAYTSASSSWTGRRTVGEQVAIVRGLAPVALVEIDALASLVASRRFNDPVTADAVQCLRELYQQLGELLAAVDRGSMTREAVEAFESNRERLAHHLRLGAKLTLVAPAMTFGIMHMLSWISGVPVDSTLVSTVFGTVVGTEALKSFGKRSSLASG